MKKKQIIFIAILVVLIFLLIFLALTLFQRILNKTTIENEFLEISEKNSKIIFSIDKIVAFSSAYSNTNINSNSNFVLENLYQYTDIALFLNNNASSQDDYSAENTLKSVYINNIKFQKAPEIGEPSLYYKNIQNFAKPTYLDENEIGENLSFEISSEEQTDLNKPVLYNNCANPISFTYVNKNIKNNYIINDAEGPITYDGSLLKKSNILLSSISCEITFDVYIINHLDQEFKCPIHINIPFEDEQKSIYDGSYTLKNDTTYTFYRLK